MIKKIKLLLITMFIMTFVNTVHSAQKDCSVFSHKIDINICEAKNRQDSSKVSTTTAEVSDVGDNKITGIFKKIGNSLKLKKHKKFRDAGDKQKIII